MHLSMNIYIVEMDVKGFTVFKITNLKIVLSIISLFPCQLATPVGFIV